MSTIFARHALTSDGWQPNVRIEITDGCLSTVTPHSDPSDLNANVVRREIVLAAPVNLHSHAFQRAMAGLTESRGEEISDSFWTWRKLMYQFLDRLTPDDVEAIAAFVQMEMLESGYASVGEFHYLHHQPNGQAYSNVAEMADRIVAASATSGIGLTLLPVAYSQGGIDGRELVGGQQRFGNSIDEFAHLYAAAEVAIQASSSDANIGVAPHSLRAVSRDGLNAALALAEGNPFHIHVAEQAAEVDEIEAAWGARPVQWLLDNHALDSQWCLIHATQMQAAETHGLAQTGATVGLCPITESSLGDGIFNGVDYVAAGGHWGVGSDSDIRISLSEELRTLEYSQRLTHRGRALLATDEKSTGRVLFEAAVVGGARATQRRTGLLATGQWADLIALDDEHINLIAVNEDGWLDAWIFASDDQVVSDVWSAGRHVVQGGIHLNREPIAKRYRTTMRAIAATL